MASAEVDGRHIAYPTIVEKDGQLIELSPDEALDYALENNEYAEFAAPEHAQWYAEGGYKQGTALEPQKELPYKRPQLEDRGKFAGGTSTKPRSEFKPSGEPGIEWDKQKMQQLKKMVEDGNSQERSVANSVLARIHKESDDADQFLDTIVARNQYKQEAKLSRDTEVVPTDSLARQVNAFDIEGGFTGNVSAETNSSRQLDDEVIQNYMSYLQANDPETFQYYQNKEAELEGASEGRTSAARTELLKNAYANELKIYDYKLEKIQEDHDVRGYISGMQTMEGQRSTIDKMVGDLGPMIDRANGITSGKEFKKYQADLSAYNDQASKLGSMKVAIDKIQSTDGYKAYAAAADQLNKEYEEVKAMEAQLQQLQNNPEAYEAGVQEYNFRMENIMQRAKSLDAVGAQYNQALGPMIEEYNQYAEQLMASRKVLEEQMKGFQEEMPAELQTKLKELDKLQAEYDKQVATLKGRTSVDDTTLDEYSAIANARDFFVRKLETGVTFDDRINKQKLKDELADKEKAAQDSWLAATGQVVGSALKDAGISLLKMPKAVSDMFGNENYTYVDQIYDFANQVNEAGGASFEAAPSLSADIFGDEGFNGRAAFGKTVRALTDVGLFAAGGSAARLASLPAEVGVFASAFTMQSGDNYQEALNAGLKPTDAARVAGIISTVSGLMEMVVPDNGYFSTPQFGTSFLKQLLSGKSAKEGLQLAFEAAPASVKRYAKAFIKEGVFEEGGEMLATDLTKEIANMVFAKELYSDTGNKKNYIETILVGGVVGLAATAASRPRTPYQEQLFAESLRNRDAVLSRLQAQDPARAKEVKKMFDEAEPVLSALEQFPKWEQIPIERQDHILSLAMQKKALAQTQSTAGVPDEQIKKQIQAIESEMAILLNAPNTTADAETIVKQARESVWKEYTEEFPDGPTEEFAQKKFKEINERAINIAKGGKVKPVESDAPVINWGEKVEAVPAETKAAVPETKKPDIETKKPISETPAPVSETPAETAPPVQGFDSGVNSLLEKLNADSKGKDVFGKVEVIPAGDLYILKTTNKAGKTLFNLVDEKGGTPEGGVMNWRRESLVRNELIERMSEAEQDVEVGQDEGVPDDSPELPFNDRTNELLMLKKRYNDLPKRERPGMGANLRRQIEKAASSLGFDVMVASGGKIDIRDQGKRVMARGVDRTVKPEQKAMEQEKRDAVSWAADGQGGLRSAIMAYFAGGGRIAESDFDNRTGLKGKDKAPYKRSRMIDASNSSDNLLDKLAIEYFSDVAGTMSESDIMNEITDVLSQFDNRRSITEALTGEYREFKLREKGDGFTEEEMELFWQEQEEGRLYEEARRQAREEFESMSQEEKQIMVDETEATMTDAEKQQIIDDYEQMEAAFYGRESGSNLHDPSSSGAVGTAPLTKAGRERLAAIEKREREIEAELASTYQARDKKKRELGKEINKENVDLFGTSERQVEAEGQLFDESVDASKDNRQKIFKPFNDKIENLLQERAALAVEKTTLPRGPETQLSLDAQIEQIETDLQTESGSLLYSSLFPVTPKMMKYVGKLAKLMWSYSVKGVKTVAEFVKLTGLRSTKFLQDLWNAVTTKRQVKHTPGQPMDTVTAKALYQQALRNLVPVSTVQQVKDVEGAKKVLDAMATQIHIMDVMAIHAEPKLAKDIQDARKALHDLYLELNQDLTNVATRVAEEIRLGQPAFDLANDLSIVGAARERLEDDFLWQKKAQQAIEKDKGKIEDEENPYMMRDLAIGKVRNLIDGLHIKLFGRKFGDITEVTTADEPLLKRAKKEGISQQALDFFMYVRHARERNERVRRMQEIERDQNIVELQTKLNEVLAKYAGNPTLSHSPADKALITRYKNEIRSWNVKPIVQDGSGISDADAAKYMNEFQKSGKLDQYEQLADEFKSTVIDPGIEMMFEAGLLTEEQRDMLMAGTDPATGVDWKYYVPLKVNGGIIADGKKSWVGAVNPIKRLKGTDKFTYLERNSPFAQAIVDFESAAKLSEDNKTKLALYRLVKNNPNAAVWDTVAAQYIIDTDRAGNVTNTIDVTPGEITDRAIPVMVKGKKQYIVFNHPGLLNAWKRTGSQPDKFTSLLFRTWRTFNNFKRWILTVGNPIFGVRNKVRDMQAALFNASGLNMPGLGYKIVKNQMRIMRTLAKNSLGRMDPNSKDARLINEYLQNGGRVSWLNADLLQDRIDKITRLSSQYSERGVPRKVAQKIYDNTLGLAVAFNEVIELSTRLSVYDALRQNGVSAPKSAEISKNMTVNFNKKGTASPFINMLYLFANAGIQANIQSLRSVVKSRRAQAVAALTILAGFSYRYFQDYLIEALSDDEEEKYRKRKLILDSEKEGNYIFPIGDDQFVKIPKDYGGMRVFFNLGEALAGVTKGESVKRHMGNWMETSTAFIDPVGGNTPNKLSAYTPTMLRGIVEVNTNKRWNDVPIRPIQHNGPPLPDYQQYFQNINPFFKDLAKNAYTTTNGAIDVSPETIEYIVEDFTGGIIKEVHNGIMEVDKYVTGKDVQKNKVPLWGDFITDITEDRWRAQTRFYEIYNQSAKRLLLPEERQELFKLATDLEAAGMMSDKRMYQMIDQVDAAQAAIIDGEEPGE